MNTYRPKFGPFLSQTRLHQQQAGFIQAALLFGIALMTAILGGFALANRSPTSQTDTEQAKVNASVILKQGSDLRDGVQRYATDNGSTAVLSTMNFSTTTGTGLFDVAARYATPQIMPTSAFTGSAFANAAPSALTAGHWFLNKTTEAPSIGLSGGSDFDPMVLLPYIRSDVCQRINRLLYGSATIPTVANAVSVVAAGTSLGAFTGADRWPEGCVATSDTIYVYFKVVQEN